MRATVLLIILVVGLGVAGGAAAFYRFATSPAGTSETSKVFQVKQGSLHAIANRLEAEGLISNSRFFVFYARLRGLAGSAKVGEYELNAGMTPGEILEIIVSGKSVAYPVTVPEGYNIFEVAELFEKKGFGSRVEFLRLARDPGFVRELLGEPLDSLEGYLFPDTYLITRLMKEADILRVMVDHFNAAYKEVEAAPAKVPMKRHEGVILASIVEKETGAPEERELVSSVFHNRIKKGMMLQTDPTVIYGVALATGSIPKNITKSDLLTPNAYNTYSFRGLPKGPIANPGKDALLAARNPEESEFLYFVSKNDGTHTFSIRLEDHNKAVRDFQLNRKAREGKSWRDLNRKSNTGN